jgi:hypothetical protein
LCCPSQSMALIVWNFRDVWIFFEYSSFSFFTFLMFFSTTTIFG